MKKSNVKYEAKLLQYQAGGLRKTPDEGKDCDAGDLFRISSIQLLLCHRPGDRVLSNFNHVVKWEDHFNHVKLEDHTRCRHEALPKSGEAVAYIQ